MCSARRASSSGGWRSGGGGGMLFVFFCPDLLENRDPKACLGVGLGRDQVCRPRSSHPSQTRSRSAGAVAGRTPLKVRARGPAGGSTPWWGCLLSAWACRGAPSTARCRPSDQLPRGFPAARKASVTIMTAARPFSATAERATATSPGSPPLPTPPPFVSAARPRAGAVSRRALRQFRHRSEAGHPR